MLCLLNKELPSATPVRKESVLYYFKERTGTKIILFPHPSHTSDFNKFFQIKVECFAMLISFEK